MGRPARRRAAGISFTGLTIALTLGACTDDPDPPTAAELLAELEGRELTEAEQSEQLETMSMLCALDDAVLVEVWDRLDADQLEFQDIAFSRICPERNQLYASATGRFAAGD